MALTFKFFDASQQYGLGRMGATPEIHNANLAIVGDFLDFTDTFGENVAVGDTGVLSSYFSGGYVIDERITITGETTGFISESNLRRADTNELLVSVTGTIAYDAENFSSPYTSDAVYAGNDTFSGSAFNNIFRGFGGNDTIDGMGGVDTAYFAGQRSQYSINLNGNQITTSGVDGTDTLFNVERLHFDDMTLAFDISGNGGKAYRLYQAAFDRTPDAGGLGFWINAIDNGAALRDVAQGFVNSAEFKSVYGATPTNAQLVTKYYENILGRAPEQGGYDYWLGILNRGVDTAAGVLANISESQENQVGLIGVIGNGFSYQPYLG